MNPHTALDRYERERRALLAQLEAELAMPGYSPSPLEAPPRFTLRDEPRLTRLTPA